MAMLKFLPRPYKVPAMADWVKFVVFFKFQRAHLPVYPEIADMARRSVEEATNEEVESEEALSEDVLSEKGGDSSSSEFGAPDEAEEEIGSESDSGCSEYFKVPAKRGKNAKSKRVRKQVSSSEGSDQEGEEDLIREGNPLLAENEALQLDSKEFNWEPAMNNVTLPWENDFGPLDEAGMQKITKRDFFKLNAFEILQLFIPISWYEDITDESNR